MRADIVYLDYRESISLDIDNQTDTTINYLIITSSTKIIRLKRNTKQYLQYINHYCKDV
jgi:hypothetical protein